MTFEDCLHRLQLKLGRTLTEDEIDELREQWLSMANEAAQQLKQQQAQARRDRFGG